MAVRSNRSFDADTHRQGAASRAREHTSGGALPARAGPLRRDAAGHALWLFDPFVRTVGAEGDPLRTFGWRGED